MSLTIDEYLSALAPEVWNDNDWATMPNWPGGAFAVAASLLERSGAYSGLGTRFWRMKKDQQQQEAKKKHNWERTARALATKWRRRSPDGKPPSQVRRWWDTIANAYETPIAEISENAELCKALVRMASVCDQVFEGVGVIPLAKLTDPETKGGRAEFEFWLACFDLLGGATGDGYRENDWENRRPYAHRYTQRDYE